MTWDVIGTCALIICARIGDVSLGTIRTVFILRGRRALAVLLGFFEVLIWVTVVSKVISNLNHPIYAVSYALGFASGNYVGMVIEHWLAIGHQALRVFSRRSVQLAESLRNAGYHVTEFAGTGRDGPITLLYTESARRDVADAIRIAERVDPDCFYVIDDVRSASSASMRTTTPRVVATRTQRK
ncbi:MAG: DUF2179 domain-containing protein [Phycisphaerales bacterium]|nr:DUF2179 domain-containing protein [Phycisphaerales bacterium]